MTEGCEMDGNVKKDKNKDKDLVGFSRFYRFMWVFMVVLAAVWGVFSGMSIAGNGVLSGLTIFTGWLCIASLSVTIFVAGQKR